MGVRTNAGGCASVGTLKNALQYADDDLGITVATSSYGEICDALESYFPPMPIGTAWSFSYLASPQKFTVPCDGIFKLEVTGACGGSSSSGSTGFKGGNSIGYIHLYKDEKLYVVTGERGKVGGGSVQAGSAYNGGGCSGSTENRGGGGGATHIARGTNRGELKNYSSYRDEVLIVAGGGGGNNYHGGNATGGEEQPMVVAILLKHLDTHSVKVLMAWISLVVLAVVGWVEKPPPYLPQRLRAVLVISVAFLHSNGTVLHIHHLPQQVLEVITSLVRLR